MPSGWRAAFYGRRVFLNQSGGSLLDICPSILGSIGQALGQGGAGGDDGGNICVIIGGDTTGVST